MGCCARSKLKIGVTKVGSREGTREKECRRVGSTEVQDEERIPALRTKSFDRQEAVGSNLGV
jgi:hypothetical protein